jgi:hypothetical protein
LVALKTVNLVSAPPSGVLCLGGQVLVEVPTNAVVLELGATKAYCGPFIGREYLHVYYTSPDGKHFDGYVQQSDDGGHPIFGKTN